MQTFAIGAAAAASLGGIVLVLTIPSAWAASAFLLTACPGILSGIALASLHGRPGGAFPLVVGLGMLVRMALAGIVTALAAREGSAALVPVLAGLTAGFVPVSAFEAFWFGRKALRGNG